jgi:hypothetical protein
MKYLALFFITTSAFAGNLQNADFATSAQITGAGGSVSQLLNSSKMYNDVDSEIFDTSIARWDAKLSSPVNLATQVSGVLPPANGGTGSSAIPSSGQIPVGNSGGTAYAPQSVSGDATLAASGALTLATVATAGSCTNCSITINAKGLVTAESSGSAGTTPEQEVPAGSVNNSNVTFTLAHSVSTAATLSVYQDGLILNQGVDYTVVTSTGVITMTTAPNFGQAIYATYQH